MKNNKGYIYIILSLIIIFGIFGLYTLTKSKPVIFNDDLDKELHKSTEKLNKNINRYNEIENILINIEKKVNNKVTNQNFDTGMDTENKSGLDKRVNIYTNLDNPEERDLTGF